LAYEPHVALVDLFIGSESGPEICEQLRKRSPMTHVLLISGAGGISPGSAKAAGASGFIPEGLAGRRHRPCRPEGEGGADRLPSGGGRQRQSALLARAGGPRPRRRRRHQSRDRCRAAPLPHTVKEYTSALYRKLDVRNRAEAVQRAQRMGLLA